MTKLVEGIAKSLVDNPSGVIVTETSGRQGTIIKLRVDSDDMGKVIGKQGRIAKALRTVVTPRPPEKTKGDSRNCKRIIFYKEWAHIYSRYLCAYTIKKAFEILEFRLNQTTRSGLQPNRCGPESAGSPDSNTKLRK